MKRKYFIIAIALVIILGMGTSLSYLTATNGSTKENKITVASFNVELLNDISDITLSNFYPMTDMEGVNNTPVTFTIKNKGSIIAGYKISLFDSGSGSTLNNSDVRFRLKRTINGLTDVLDIKTLDSMGLLDTSTIEADQEITYELVLWQDYNSTATNATFNKSIRIDASQIASLDTSGANYPELVDNMIPVYYDTTGVWRKADSKNLNSSFKWFDYDNQMWANAVTVKETGTKTRDYYLNASAGEEISMDDITTMWVWIPRYKYKVFNGNNGAANEQMIDVMFEHGIETTGTLTCDNNNENCGTIINNKSTYTHPAFTFGNDELTGFWMAKYEMATDDTNCNTNQDMASCNNTGLNIIVKANQNSLKQESISTMFANIRRMEISTNIHGFSQSVSADNWLDINSNLSGVIANDDNKFDIHMVKNMEWGAVAYLSNSKYGKQQNGISSFSINPYGVDTGSSNEYVMGNMLTNGGDFNPQSSGVWSATNYLDNKYYDKYSYSDNGYAEISQKRGKLGDATTETMKTFGVENGSWYSFSSVYPNGNNSWIIRNSNNLFGLSSQTGEASTITSRPVLAVTREMPWLNNN